MNIELRKISKAEFKNIKTPTLFEDIVYDRAFGVVSNGENEYKIGWWTDGYTQPEIKLIDINICTIGIDLVFIIFEFNTGRIRLKLSLSNYFYFTRIFNGFLYVISEFDIFKINIKNLDVVETFALPDIYTGIEEESESYFIVKCMDGRMVTIK
ncbi:hypothetical protein [Emticicia fluvialis]|uniref:hypothetical protein n=1 Tax=Emticicia fluvialis TaxID=2974474 RepID=UPI00216522B5|nr:hypothetical protein [Emticicia fluvialis]